MKGFFVAVAKEASESCEQRFLNISGRSRKAGGWEELNRAKAVVFSSDAFQKSDLRLKANHTLPVCNAQGTHLHSSSCRVEHSDKKQLSGGKGLPGCHVPVYH